MSGAHLASWWLSSLLTFKVSVLLLESSPWTERVCLGWGRGRGSCSKDSVTANNAFTLSLSVSRSRKVPRTLVKQGELRAHPTDGQAWDFQPEASPVAFLSCALASGSTSS